jgi:hypothetical protein
MSNDYIELGPNLDRLKDKLAGIANRVAIWKNKASAFLNIGRKHDRSNPFLAWRIGATEKHCPDCARLNGQVHTAERWRRAGIEPQSPDLECNGFNCACFFEEHDGPESGDF